MIFGLFTKKYSRTRWCFKENERKGRDCRKSGMWRDTSGYVEDSFLTLKEISCFIIISAGFMVGATTAWTTPELLNPLATAWLPLSWDGRQFDGFTSWDSIIYLFILFIYSLVFIYLTVPGLSCCMQDLVLWPRIGPRPLHWEYWDLGQWTTRKAPTFLNFPTSSVYPMVHIYGCPFLLTFSSWPCGHSWKSPMTNPQPRPRFRPHAESPLRTWRHQPPLSASNIQTSFIVYKSLCSPTAHLT